MEKGKERRYLSVAGVKLLGDVGLLIHGGNGERAEERGGRGGGGGGGGGGRRRSSSRTRRSERSFNTVFSLLSFSFSFSL